MRNLFAFFCFAALFISCRQPVRINGKTLTDTLEILKKKADFRPLDSVEAYAFINKYYLPRLDTMYTGRKLFLYSLRDVNFDLFFRLEKTGLERAYSGDKNILVPPPGPPSLFFNKARKWDEKRLLNTRVVSDSLLLSGGFAQMPDVKSLRKKFGYGYMCISYPQYNASTKLLVFREWIENFDWCGTGRERVFHYKKTTAGWEAY